MQLWWLVLERRLGSGRWRQRLTAGIGIGVGIGWRRPSARAAARRDMAMFVADGVGWADGEDGFLTVLGQAQISGPAADAPMRRCPQARHRPTSLSSAFVPLRLGPLAVTPRRRMPHATISDGALSPRGRRTLLGTKFFCAQSMASPAA